uniref:TSC22 domain family protein 1 n=1 Tax=Oncorhynchus kisutch TaxID=8019 RepID=A0A8C7JKD8_ONCKI
SPLSPSSVPSSLSLSLPSSLSLSFPSSLSLSFLPPSLSLCPFLPSSLSPSIPSSLSLSLSLSPSIPSSLSLSFPPHLMYAVREEVDVLKEQIKELNSLLKTLASPEQMAQFQAQSSPALAPRQRQAPLTPSRPHRGGTYSAFGNKFRPL